MLLDTSISGIVLSIDNVKLSSNCKPESNITVTSNNWFSLSFKLSSDKISGSDNSCNIPFTDEL